MTQKSPNAFRTISEVADTLNVPAHVLRFWETKFTHIKPVKRGGGRRYYRPSDVSLIKGIRDLLYDDGLTIKGVQKILRQKGARHVMDIADGRATAFDDYAIATEASPPARFVEHAVAEPRPPFNHDKPVPKGTTPDLFSSQSQPGPQNQEDLVNRLSDIAEGETQQRDELRNIVRKMEKLRDKMRGS